MKTLTPLLALLTLAPSLPAWNAQAADANLKSADGSAIVITFDPAGGTGTPGSSAVSFFAENVRVDVTVPFARAGSGDPMPISALAKLLAVTRDGAYVDQYITLIGLASVPGGARFSGAASYGLLIKSYDSGHETRYQQFLELDLNFNDVRNNRVLVNPVDGSTRFQTDLAAASGQ